MKLVCANVNKSVRLPDVQVISRYKVGQSSVTITSDGRYIDSVQSMSAKNSVKDWETIS